QKKCFDISPAARTLALVFDALKLENNNVFLPGALAGLINTDLVNRYEAGEGPKELEDILRLAGIDLLQTLGRFNLTPSQVGLDISRSQVVTGASLREFREFFMPAVKAALEDLKKEANAKREPPVGEGDTPNRDQLSQLCLLTLISGQEWPKEI